MIKRLLVLFFFILSSCSGVEDAITLKKKSSADEFLVKKKSPLVIPPDFDKLPSPNEDKNIEIQITDQDQKEIEQLFKNQKNTIIRNNKTDSSLEKSILKKIR